MSDVERLSQEKRLADAIRTRCFVPPAYDFRRIDIGSNEWLLGVEIYPSRYQVAVRTAGKPDAPYVFPLRTGTQKTYRVPDLADHTFARRFALQLRQIGIGKMLLLGEARAAYSASLTQKRILLEVDLESLTFVLGWPGGTPGAETKRCQDIVKIYDPPAPGGVPYYEIDMQL